MKKCILISMLICTMTLAVTPLIAGELTEIVKAALKRNEAVRSLDWESTQYLEAYRATRGKLFPYVWFQAEGIRSNNPPFVWMSKMSRADVTPDMMNLKGFNDPDAVTNFLSSVNLFYPLYYGGAIISFVEAKRIESEAAHNISERKKEEIALDVIKAYMEIAWRKSRVKAAKKYVESARYHLKQAESRYKAGMALKSDVLKAKVYLTKAEEHLIRETTSLDIASRRLSMLMGYSPEIATKINSNIESLYRELKDYRCSIGKALKEALSKRRDLAAQLSKVKATEKEIDIAKAEYMPHIDIISSFNWYGHNYPLQGEQSSWTIGAVLKLNIFDGFSREHRIKKAKARKIKQEYSYLYFKKEVELQVIRSIKEIEDARKRIELTKNSVEEAKESLRIMEKRYQQGLATITELTDTQHYLEVAESMYLEALYNYLLSVYKTEYAKGTLMKFIGL